MSPGRRSRLFAPESRSGGRTQQHPPSLLNRPAAVSSVLDSLRELIKLRSDGLPGDFTYVLVENFAIEAFGMEVFHTNTSDIPHSQYYPV